MFVACIGCFGLFAEIKKGSRTSIQATLSLDFFHKNVAYLILCQLTKFQDQTYFPYQDIKQHVFLNSCLANW